MLEIITPEVEMFNQKSEEFVTIKSARLQLEHSLISVKKWEQKWHKPFLGKNDRTYEEICDYIRCMTINYGIDPLVYTVLNQDIINQVLDYMGDPMTATTINEKMLTMSGLKKNSREQVTAEIIYYWMIALAIPVESFEKWHLNQLLTLIKVVNIKNGKAPKMNKKEAAKERAALNAQRRAKYKSKG